MRRSHKKHYKGRYCGPVSTSNLVHDDDDDFPEFEPFDDSTTARGFAPAGAPLSVQSINMCQMINKPNHHTTAYDIPDLVVRRGQEFVMKVTFSRRLTAADDFQLEFLIGDNPTASQGSLVVVTFGSRPAGPWSGRIIESKSESVMLGVTPTASAIVGKFRTYVAVVTGGGMQRTKRDVSTDLYLLFNAWCTDDATFLSDDTQRTEYVLNDYGIIYQGSVEETAQRSWMYGQFERGVLDACIYILDVSHMPIHERGNVIRLVRKGSAMINSQDDNGVCVGNWSDDFSMGTSPSAWTGSVKILLQYASTRVPVCYAQCWVFAGVFNTFLRCLGIPARVVTNFISAHDNGGDLTTSLIFTTDGVMDSRNTRDSIWNFHCWNEVFIARSDLPPGLGGWQVVDSTPQETSGGFYRCGPASITAIKQGLLCYPFDLRFIFAEVNSEVIYYKRDRYGVLTPYKVDRDYVGKAIYTKSIGSDYPQDITNIYKYPKGSDEDNKAMAKAEEFGCVRDSSEMSDATLSVVISTGQVFLGEDVNLSVEFQNLTNITKRIQGSLTGFINFYTGVSTSHFEDQNFTVTVPAKQKQSVALKLAAEEYMPQLGSQLSLNFVVTVQDGDQSLSAMKVVNLQTPDLIVTVSGPRRVRQQMFVTVSFTNPFPFPLLNATLTMEGSGLMDVKTRFFSDIDPQGSISWNESFVPRLVGPRRLMAVMDCSNLRNVSGFADVVITA